MSSKTVYPARGIDGVVVVPGDKSISHRAALLAAIAQGNSDLSNYAPSDDCQSTLHCLKALGVSIESSSETIRIEGRGSAGLSPSENPLDAGNSGTTMRLLSGILAGQRFETVITGDESLQRRPMKRIIEPLSLMGAQIKARDGNFAPLRIRGGRLRSISYALPVASAQVKSCVLLAGLFAEGATTIHESISTRNHTEIMLRQYGAEIEVSSASVSLTGPAMLKGCEYRIPGDLSSAAFLIAAALMLPGSHLRLMDVGVNPTRTGFLDLLRQLGGKIKPENERYWHGEPVADLAVFSSRLKAPADLTLDRDTVPGIIDEIPILAVLATQTEGGLMIRGAGELRVKESDRIHALVENLRQLGVRAEEFEDGFYVPGPQSLRGGSVNSFGDHRIAMAFAIGGLLAERPVEIQSREAVNVSFPDFFDSLERVIRR